MTKEFSFQHMWCLVGWLVSGAAVVLEPGHAPLKEKWDSAAKLNSEKLTLQGEFEDVLFSLSP